MFPLAQKYVERVVLVEDDAIRRAQSELWRVLRVASEPGGAAAMAALLSGVYQPAHGERGGGVLCGGNTDPLKPLLLALVQRALQNRGLPTMFRNNRCGRVE